MTILDKIISDKIKEVAVQKERVPVSQLEKMSFFQRTTASLAEALKTSRSGIIAEHKRRSPSKSIINDGLDVAEVAKGYEKAGVCGMSVLTDETYFGGSLNDLLIARTNCNLPILRKEFIIDPYQIIEAKAHGADAILLIAAILTKNEILRFSKMAKELQLEVLLEVHNESELQQSNFPSIDMLGVNNRNLKTFEVSLETSKSLSKLIPNEYVKVSESGISSMDAIAELRTFDYKGFLIGEHFMKTNDPGASAFKLINQLES